jgi:hypothetical protein
MLPFVVLRQRIEQQLSLAVLFVFGFSEMEMRAVHRQLDGCGGSQQTAIPIGWTGDASFPRALPSPAFRLVPSGRPPGPAGCSGRSCEAAVAQT